MYIRTYVGIYVRIRVCAGMEANGSDLATDVMHLLTQHVCTAMLRAWGLGVGQPQPRP